MRMPIGRFSGSLQAALKDSGRTAARGENNDC